ncbi:condensation domain-containing protein, partial [Chryseobacterium sp. WG14]|uniref:condensation domain-containing protein n=1 Tax=Chryseobacterium sp. WG14 TaxID=2926909 RepID=UPI00211E2E1A
IVSHADGRVVDQITEIQNRISELNTHSDINLAALHHDGRRIFSSLFVYENYPVPKGGEGNELGFVFMDSVEKLDYPLGIMASEQGDSVAVKINYEGVLFEEQTIQQLIEGMETLLDQILKNKKITSDQLAYVSDNQIKLIQSWNVIDPVESDKTLHELFESQASRTPDAVALVYGEVKLSYKEL